ncbi:HAMP domain-containing histidine kinase [Pseudomonas sp. LS1212]|uniref:sensor histidine kinase n=1 Tax=Pseudomonas sp. LS1212 TaxID=2972478 RepID=UPI00215C8DF5|nr:HAMP domain-containing sensor histidine kinase [Pseudomonas sp. LS1212]UVJ41811.1 HAMP domain-containing histidine kinase [Pseudomonas sp. LS1212]
MQMVERKDALSGASAEKAMKASRPQFNLLRWFSLVSLGIIASVAVGLGLITTRFLVNESVERDALLTAQFIHALGAAEVRHVEISNVRTMGELLDPRQDMNFPDVMPEARARARDEFLDHILHLPDVLLANIYAPDHVIIWSSNPALIGQRIAGDEDLENAFRTRQRVSSSYHKVSEERMEQKFPKPPEFLFIENYIPLFDADEQTVTAMVEIYKEPKDLIARIDRGFVLIWLATAFGGGLIYFGLYWIVRRAAGLLESQQRQLITNETFVALGEMSSAVAHSLRNPLASIRSSAELAQEVAGEPAQKNIEDIISQVDRMSKWVRELLQSLRPLSEESEEVNLVATVQDSLHAYALQIKRSNVRVEYEPQPMPPVVSQQVQLTQILNSLLGNALEAMPNGGVLKIELEPEPANGVLRMFLTDSGKGMTRQQEQMVFKPFFTTKQGGLGVGLMLVKRIMERFGGAVSLSSREAEGTRVNLVFRIAAGGEHGAQHSGR